MGFNDRDISRYLVEFSETHRYNKNNNFNFFFKEFKDLKLNNLWLFKFE
jgi:hypothetical protein